MSTHFPASVLTAFAASMFMFALGFWITTNTAMKRRFFSLPALAQKAYVVLFMAPLVAIPLVPHERYTSAGAVARVGGALLLACALALWVSALRAMRGIPSMRKARGLVTSGVYALVRNPLYTANSLVLPGLGLLTDSLPSLIFTPVVFALFLVQSVLEERELRVEYGEEYASYQKRVRQRLLPFVL